MLAWWYFAIWGSFFVVACGFYLIDDYDINIVIVLVLISLHIFINYGYCLQHIAKHNEVGCYFHATLLSNALRSLLAKLRSVPSLKTPKSLWQQQNVSTQIIFRFSTSNRFIFVLFWSFSEIVTLKTRCLLMFLT